MGIKPGTTLRLQVNAKNVGTQSIDASLSQAIIAGWTGRDAAAMEAHIAELEELGVTRPPRTPMFYRVSANRITTNQMIEVPGADSSGEAEFVLFRVGDATYVGLGSDHTDRKAETFNVTVSKQMCDKPVAPEVWPLGDVRDHWDELILRSHAIIDGERVLYQEGRVSGMLRPEDLLEGFGAEGGQFGDGSVMLCGTLPAIGGIRIADEFEMELEDPVLGRSIHTRYAMVSIPNEG